MFSSGEERTSILEGGLILANLRRGKKNARKEVEPAGEGYPQGLVQTF